MTQNEIDMFLIANKGYLPEDKLFYIRTSMQNLPQDRLNSLALISFDSPILMLIISIFLGQLGVDRFILGDVGLGLGKLLTCGGFGIWWLIDVCCIMKATKKKNFKKLALYI